MEEKPEKKKRERKKKIEIKDIKDLIKDNSTTIKESTKQEIAQQKEMKTIPFSFGGFEGVIKKEQILTYEELREHFDKKFEINDSEKIAKIGNDDFFDDDIIYEPIMEYEENNKLKIKEKIKSYRILSNFFEKLEQNSESEWPNKTDILCWWCCSNFDSVPLPCPVEYNEQKDIFKINGIFCSWPCVAAYSIEKYESLSLVYKIRNKFMGYNISEEISIAPSRYILKNFGGYMNIKDFRKNEHNIMISTDGLSYVNQEIIDLKY